jgi:D-alanine-D-alanine ligase
MVETTQGKMSAASRALGAATAGENRGMYRVRIGVAFNVRADQGVGRTDFQPAPPEPRQSGRLGLPGDDADEEFDSPQTIQALADALSALGHDVELLGYGEPMLERLLRGPRPDLVWNTAEGNGCGRSREARVPAVMEMLDIPYTGSDPLTLAATLDKDCAKRLVALSGVATPAWLLVEPEAAWDATELQVAALRFPVFVKPAFEGSSKGVLTNSIIHDPTELRLALAELAEVYRQPVLVEEFIDGDELTVGMVGNRPPEVIGVMRVLPGQPSEEPFVYSLEVKRDWQHLARYECPAQLSSKDTASVREAALACWQALGCRDVARIDFRLRQGVPYFLEANPLPGLSPESGDLVILSGRAGVEYRDLVGRILEATMQRCQLVSEPSLGG